MPSQLAARYDQNNALKIIEAKLKDRRGSLIDRMAAARMEGDADARSEVQAEIDSWNATNPDLRIRPVDIARSITARRRAGRNVHSGIYLDKKIGRRLLGEFGYAEPEA